MSGRAPSPREPGGGQPGAIRADARRTPPAHLPGRVHAARRDPLRHVCAERRESDLLAFGIVGRTIVPCGASAANVLGLTTQNPVLSVYLTSGPDRRLCFGRQTVRLRHAPRWQLAAPYRRAGDAVRALAWFGPREIEDALAIVAPRLSADDMAELAAARATMPAWMAAPVSAPAGDG